MRSLYANGRSAFTTCRDLAPLDEAAIDQWPLCLDSPRMGAAPCEVYSFGIANDWRFDDALASRGCHVDAFDPTSRFRAAHERRNASGISFHYLGLQSELPAECRHGEGREQGGQYGALGGALLGLSSLAARLGHGAAPRLDVLKIGASLPLLTRVDVPSPSQRLCLRLLLN